MPCTDGSCHDSGDEIRELRSKVNMLTDMLCNVCSRLETSGSMPPISLDAYTSQWWQEHKKQDLVRKTREMVAKKQQIAYKKRQMEELAKEIEDLKK